LLKIMAGRGQGYCTGEAWARRNSARVGIPGDRSRDLDPAQKPWQENVMEGPEGPDQGPRSTGFTPSIRLAMAEAGCRLRCKLMAEMGRFAGRRSTPPNGWELDRTVEIAMDALRCPPADADVTKGLSGGERRRVALCRLLLLEKARHVAAR
jgi:sulfate-transporting ATPase